MNNSDAINSTISLSDADLIFSYQPSFTQVLRAVKRQEHSLFNALASILHDAQFVQQVLASHPEFAAIPNRRCGLWYINPRQYAQSCHFKSTDGHTRNLRFSLTRLNWKTAQEAARHGGAFIIDATRRGKRFPDALSKTVPIWAAVFNRALDRYKQQASPHQQEDPAEEQQQRGSDDVWQQVYLPPWIESTERQQIEQQIDGWMDELMQVCVDLKALAAVLEKPFRCYWVSQGEEGWRDQLPCLGDVQKHCTPLIMVSASLPNARMRRRLILDSEIDVMYDYIPGAGDDEESWSQGLTPGTFWRHHIDLIAGGVEGLDDQLMATLDDNQQQNIQAKEDEEEQDSLNQRNTDSSGSSAGVYAIADTGLTIVSGTTIRTSQSQHWDAAVFLDTIKPDSQLTAPVVDHQIWAPVSTTKSDRWSLLQQLPLVVEFMSNHLQQGRHIVLVGDDVNVAVCVALACLLACYRLKWSQGSHAFVWTHPFKLCPTSKVPLTVVPFERTSLKRYLAALALHCPDTTPSKALLKQVYNWFVPNGMGQRLINNVDTK